MRFTLPAPRVLTRPILWLYLAVRTVYFFLMRVCVCEPLFKAYCTEYGSGVRTGVFIHWIMGKGRLIVGNNVVFDGKCSITFAARFSENPTLQVGDNTGIGHGCSFAVAKGITIGRDCRIATEVFIFDSSGHPTNPHDRLMGLPPPAEDVKPVHIGDNVWIGRRAIIFPGVTVGDGSVISTGAVVTSDVPPYTLVAGNPARKLAVLPQEPSGSPS